MANYPGAIDSAASLFTPVDAFSTKPLQTTTTGAVQVGDSTINVASTSGGFAATYGILSIDDELIVYSGRTGTSFTGCQRGAFGTAAASHNNGAAVKANMVAGFITALQSAVLAIENELGTAAARNYVRKDGAVTCTGLKTFQDGAEFGSGTKAGTGLVRLPNNGAIKWRKQDYSGDLGMALNASNHLAMDAIIDFAVGQTFGAFSYPDATTAAKGIVQIDAVGGLAVNAGVLSIADTAVTPGTWPKVTVDQKGRVTAGALLVAADLPAHTHTASDIVSGSIPFLIKKAGVDVGTRRALNLIEGTSIGLTVADDPGNDRVNVTVAVTSVASHPCGWRYRLRHAGGGARRDGRQPLCDGAWLPEADRRWCERHGGGARRWRPAVAHPHVGADQRRDRRGDRQPRCAPRRVGRRILRAGGGDQPRRVARFAPPVHRVRRVRNGWRAVREHGEVLGGLLRGHVGQERRVLLGYGQLDGGAGWQHDRRHDHSEHHDAGPPAADRGPRGRRAVHVLRLGEGRVRNQEGVPRDCEQRVCRLSRRSHAGHAHDVLATVQDHRHAGRRADGPLDRRSPVRRQRRRLDLRRDLPACLQQGNDPKKAYVRTWANQTSPVAAGVACGPLLVVGKDTSESPLKVRGPGSPLADHTLLEVTAGGDLIIAGGTGNGYRLAELMGATNPSGWSGVLKVKNPAGATAGYILLYSNP